MNSFKRCTQQEFYEILELIYRKGQDENISVKELINEIKQMLIIHNNS